MITARVHPGESQSSWVAKGLIDFLTGPSAEAQILYASFVQSRAPTLRACVRVCVCVCVCVCWVVI